MTLAALLGCALAAAAGDVGAPNAPTPAATLVSSAPPAALAPAPAPPAVANAGPRLLFGVGLHLGGGFDQTNNQQSGGGGVGVYVRAGEQFDDHWATEGELSAASVVAVSYLRGAVTADFTPTDAVTFALGPVVKDDIFLGSGQRSVGGTARVDLHIGPKRTPSRRSAFTIGLAGDVAATEGNIGTVGAGGTAWGLYVGTGWAWY